MGWHTKGLGGGAHEGWVGKGVGEERDIEMCLVRYSFQNPPSKPHPYLFTTPRKTECLFRQVHVFNKYIFRKN